jgi:hypothetical protein
MDGCGVDQDVLPGDVVAQNSVQFAAGRALCSAKNIEKWGYPIGSFMIVFSLD